MATQNHTPGPWSVDLSNRNSVTVRDNNYPVAEMWLSDGRHHANARLIAAAPELLEALQLLDQAHNGPWDGAEQERYIAIANDKARAAIAKATK